jgi:asparagine synthase (glutamine-hydrolysing)
MCGIAGVLHFDGAPVEQAVLERMGAALRHRGPDAQGLFRDHAAAPAVGFVHRRLSVIDLSHAADQPLGGEDGSVQVMLNGEVYNFAALRAELAGRHHFRSQGDTEAIVHGYEEEGDRVVERLDGMFAFALWDGRRRRLLLARDHFGKKPLYYWCDARRLVFASEIKALLAAGVPAEMAHENLPEQLALGYVPTPRTLFRGILRLPPASVLAADGTGAVAPRAFWDLAFPAADAVRDVSLPEATERLTALLREAVRKRLTADVPLGVLLSGGLDSSVVAALAARESGAPLRTFTVGFEGDAVFDERAHARRVADHLGARHHDSVVRPHAAALLDTLLRHHDEPFGDSSALPTYLLAQEARREVTVALNGDGGDEAFAGYERFHAALAAERMPLAMRRALGAMAQAVPSRLRSRTARRLRRFAAGASLPLPERIFTWSTYFDGPALARLLRDPPPPERVQASYQAALERCADATPLSRLLYLNARTYLLDDLLPKMDRMTMAHGLEARSPLLDRTLVEFVAGLPDGLKRRGRTGKRVLKEAARGLLPPAILRRRKQGFAVPLDAWFRGELRPLVGDVLQEGSRLGRRLRPGAVEGLLREHHARRADHGNRLWNLLTVELWLRQHGFD